MIYLNNEQENLSLKTEKNPGKTLEFHIWKRVGTLFSKLVQNNITERNTKKKKLDQHAKFDY